MVIVWRQYIYFPNIQHFFPLIIPSGCYPDDDHTSQQPPGGASEVSGVGRELNTVTVM